MVRLNGKKLLVSGNHDQRHLGNKSFQSKFSIIKDSYHEVKVKYQNNEVLLVLCHYPLQSWNGMRYGSFHFHGHLHNHPIELKIPRMKDIGVDTREDLGPWGKNEILDFLINKKE